MGRVGDEELVPCLMLENLREFVLLERESRKKKGEAFSDADTLSSSSDDEMSPSLSFQLDDMVVFSRKKRNGDGLSQMKDDSEEEASDDDDDSDFGNLPRSSDYAAADDDCKSDNHFDVPLEALRAAVSFHLFLSNEKNEYVHFVTEGFVKRASTNLLLQTNMVGEDNRHRLNLELKSADKYYRALVLLDKEGFDVVRVIEELRQKTLRGLSTRVVFRGDSPRLGLELGWGGPVAGVFVISSKLTPHDYEIECDNSLIEFDEHGVVAKSFTKTGFPAR